MSPASDSDPRAELTARWADGIADHKAHAISQWPLEACGLLRPDGSYLACDNTSATPLVSFRLAKGVFEREDPAAILHSHTSGVDERGATVAPQDCPSAADMVSQMDTGVPWGITLVSDTGSTDPIWFGDEVPRPPLYGRQFRHGIDDCYAFIRDWYRVNAGIVIPDFPRDPDWWESASQDEPPEQDLYQEGFAEAGFVQTDRDFRQILPGDVFLCKVRSRHVFNHGGVYIGEGLIGHHLSHQLSQRDPASIWRPKLGFLVRHRDLPEDWVPPESATSFNEGAAL